LPAKRKGEKADGGKKGKNAAEVQQVVVKVERVRPKNKFCKGAGYPVRY